jgi:hypothetical protein
VALGRKDRETDLRSQIARLQAVIDDDERAARQFDGMAARTGAQLDELAAREVDGTLTGEQVSRQVDEIGADARAAQLNADQKRRVAAQRRAELAELERELERVPFDEVVEQLRKATASRTNAATEFAKTLRAITRTAVQLDERRNAEAELLAEAERLRPAWLETELVLPDEEAHPAGVDVLIMLLKAGPFAPARDAAARGRTAETQRAAAVEKRTRDAVEAVSRSLFADRDHDERELRRFDIPADRREEVLDSIADRRAERVVEWERVNPQQAEARRRAGAVKT